MYYLGNYLLVKGRHTYLEYFAAGPLEWYPEWKIDLGAPAAAAAADAAALLQNGVYRRDFAKGSVLVNPSGSPVTVALGGTYQRVVPSGGGAVGTSGTEPGSLYDDAGDIHPGAARDSGDPPEVGWRKPVEQAHAPLLQPRRHRPGQGSGRHPQVADRRPHRGQATVRSPGLLDPRRDNDGSGLLALSPHLTWIGHASFVLRLGGALIATDPVFATRMGPRRRLTPPGVAPERLPPLDIVTVSHSHYDHMNIPSLRGLAARGSRSSSCPRTTRSSFEPPGSSASWSSAGGSRRRSAGCA